MSEKYSCPRCGQELDEKYVITCTCPRCHGIFDKPAIQQASAREDQEKEHPGEGEADKKIAEEHEELPSKNIKRVGLLALLSLSVVLLVSYFTLSRIITNKQVTQERAQPATLQQLAIPQQKEGENAKQAETPPAGQLKELEEGAPLPIPQPQKEEAEKRPEGSLQTEKLPEAEVKAISAEKLQPETGKTLEKVRLTAQTEKLSEAEAKTISARKLQQETEKALRETRLTAQREAERQFQSYYHKGETAFQNGSYAEALEFYQEALTHKPGDSKTQKKISYTFAKLQYAQQTKQAEPGQNKKQGTDMVFIPAGEFRMGSPKDEGAAEERPQHKVSLSAYYIDKYEVTVAQYRAFCQATGRKMPKAPSWGWQDNHPIIHVIWDDAVAYANYCGKRLPTEAEWEKAARAGSTTRYYFGNNEADLKDYAWYSVNSNHQTHPVGARKPNAFGLYDMYGNVWEWCGDWHEHNYYANSPKNNPPGPTSGTLRVVRGGGWGYTAENCRSEIRGGLSPSYWDSCLGFRCASSP